MFRRRPRTQSDRSTCSFRRAELPRFLLPDLVTEVGTLLLHPPPYRVNSSAISESLNRVGKPPPPSSSSSSSISSSTSSRTPAGPPPPPPPIRNGHSNFSSSKSIIDDFESKFNFHPMEELPPPEEYRPFNKVYPSRNNKGMMRGAPPAPPVGR
ncbi:WAS/WASL-interacting protein family member 2 [Pleuronectes platessa]|uniref:WAS/WASL-interacting protein family member 2 n=1 Tax=Pleuronectes platessa TaxID=8262 RepID=UPI00232A4FA7|nr:WAS/WASL-interacting protein family member 2 [Pleuronectes platessa]